MGLDEVRKQLDGIDDQLSALFLRRLRLVEEIARHKKAAGLSAHQPGREEEIIARLCAGADEQHAPRLASLYRHIFRLSRDLQQDMGLD